MVGGMARHQGLVLFFHPVARVGQPVGQVAVVGQQHQPLAVGVEPPHRVDARLRRHQAGHGAPPLRVVGRADHPQRLVQQVNDMARCFLPRIHRHTHPLAVQGHLVLGRVHARAQLRDHHAVHLHAPGADHLLGGPARGHPGVCQHLLQPFPAGRRGRAGALRRGARGVGRGGGFFDGPPGSGRRRGAAWRFRSRAGRADIMGRRDIPARARRAGQLFACGGAARIRRARRASPLFRCIAARGPGRSFRWPGAA